MNWQPAATGGAVKEWQFDNDVDGTQQARVLLAGSVRTHTFSNLDVSKKVTIIMQGIGAGGERGDIAVARNLRALDANPPVFASAAVDGAELTVTFDEALDTSSAPAGAAFSLSAASPVLAARTIHGMGTASISGDTVTVNLAGPVFSFETLTLRYEKPADNPLRDLQGNEAAGFSGQPAANNTEPDTTPPAVTALWVNGRTLTAAFDEPLYPGFTGEWAVAVDDGAAAGIASATIANDRLTLTLPTAVRPGQEVRLLYVPNAATAVRDLSGNLLAWTDGFRDVTNATLPPNEGRPPAIAAATVNGLTLSIDFQWLLDAGSVPAPGDFRVTADGWRRLVSSGGVAIRGATVTLTLQAPVEPGQRVFVSYTAPADNPLRDAYRHLVAGFTNRPVTNVAPYPEATARQAYVAVPFDRPLYHSTTDTKCCPVPSAYTVKVWTLGETPRRQLTLRTVWSSTKDRHVELRVNWSHHAGELWTWDGATVSYDKTTAQSHYGRTDHIGGPLRYDDVRDENDKREEVESFTDRPLTELTPVADHRAPQARWAQVVGATLTLAFDEDLDPASVPPGNAFSVEDEATVLGPARVEGSLVKLNLDRAIYHPGPIRVTYTPPETGGLRDLAGNRAGALSWSTPLGGPDEHDTTPPTLTGATASFRDLFLIYDETMDEGPLPSPYDFRVTVNGEVRWAWAEEIVNGNTVRLILEGPSVAWGDEVRVRYTKPANPRPRTGPLRDQSRNEAASFPFRTAVNKMPRPADTTPPRVYRASVDGTRLTITFDENLDPAVIPHGGNFALIDAADSSNVFAGGTNLNAVISGATVTVALERPVPHGLTVTLHMSSHILRDLAGNNVPAIVGHEVRNERAPTFSSASVDGTTLIVTFDGNLDTGSVPAPGAFNVTVGSARRNVASGGVAINGATVTLTLASAVAFGETVTLAYTKPAANPLQDAAGNAVDTFTGQPVENNEPDTTAPTVSSAEVNGTTLTITFNENLDTGSAPAGSAFTVTATRTGSAARTLRGTGMAMVSGMTATVTLASAAINGDTVTLAYTKPPTNPLRDTAGNQVAAFTGRTVTNNTTYTPPAGRIRNLADLGQGCVQTPCPDAPTGNAYPGPGHGEITMTWTLATSGGTPTRWEVGKRESGVGSYDSQTLNDASARSHLFTGLDPSKTYDVRVRGHNTLHPGDIARAVNVSVFTLDTTAPTVSSAEVNGTTLTITFNENLDTGSAPAGSAFTVTATRTGSAARTLRGTGMAMVSGMTATVTLASAAINGDTVTLAYTKPPTNPLRDTAGNQVAAFTGRTVTNNTP